MFISRKMQIAIWFVISHHRLNIYLWYVCRQYAYGELPTQQHQQQTLVFISLAFALFFGVFVQWLDVYLMQFYPIFFAFVVRLFYSFFFSSIFASAQRERRFSVENKTWYFLHSSIEIVQILSGLGRNKREYLINDNFRIIDKGTGKSALHVRCIIKKMMRVSERKKGELRWIKKQTYNKLASHWDLLRDCCTGENK